MIVPGLVRVDAAAARTVTTFRPDYTLEPETSRVLGRESFGELEEGEALPVGAARSGLGHDEFSV